MTRFVQPATTARKTLNQLTHIHAPTVRTATLLGLPMTPSVCLAMLGTSAAPRRPAEVVPPRRSAPHVPAMLLPLASQDVEAAAAGRDEAVGSDDVWQRRRERFLARYLAEEGRPMEARPMKTPPMEAPRPTGRPPGGKVIGAPLCVFPLW